MTLTEISLISQICLTIITFTGILVSIWLSTKALREIQIDRQHRQQPYLAFETGGWDIAIKFVKVGKRIPGINPKYVEQIFYDLPEDAESVRIKSFDFKFGNLKNYGLGTALLTSVTWIPYEIHIGSEKFTIDSKKLTERVYCRELNNMPAVPSHILPNQNARLTRLPTFIEKDIEKKISTVDGLLEINYKDVFKNDHITKQNFFIKTYYKEDEPHIIISFSDIVENISN